MELNARDVTVKRLEAEGYRRVRRPGIIEAVKPETEK
jgi:hypothetical protein